MTVPPNAAVYETAQALHAAGFSVVPPTEDGVKKPRGFWAEYQKERATLDRLRDWYVVGGFTGVGAVFGAVSGNAEFLEWEDARTFNEYRERCGAEGLRPLLDRIINGYAEKSPGGGLHVIYRCAVVTGNIELAKRPKRPEEMLHPHDKYQMLIETRGEGGYGILAPSNGKVHPTGGAYELLRGGPATIVTITPEEREDLHAIARTFDQTEQKTFGGGGTRARPSGEPTGDRPGDDYERRTSWQDLLTRYGWTHVFDRGEVSYWRRPGKSHGWSATVNYKGGDVLKVFTSSTELDAEATYTRFGLYATMEHGGDFKAAAKELAAKGYGKRSAGTTRSTAETTGTSGATNDEAPTAPFALTDLGNAQRLVDRHGTDLRYCHPWAKWLVWDGARWRPDDVGEVVSRAKDAARSIHAEAAATPDLDGQKAIGKHAIKSQARDRISAMIVLAESEPGVPVRPDDLDRDLWLLACRNGVVDLRTGAFRPASRSDLVTKLTTVDYDPDAECPTFLRFLDRIMGGNADLIAFLRRAFGYALTGAISERVIFFLHGASGRNGKSTLLETVGAVLGDYAGRARTELLLATRDNGIPNDVAALKGVRFVTASEADEGRRLDEAKVKELTGGDTITARFMRAEWFTFLPQFKVFLGTNHRPVVRGTDEAIWDRIRLVPFDVRIPDAEQDKRLREKLIAEGAGILAWAVRGCLEWRRDGLGWPEAVRTATDGYRTEMDTIGAFLGDCCDLAASLTVTCQALYAAYRKWSEAGGEKPITQTAFSKRLSERGFRQGRRRDARYWQEIGLREGHQQTTFDDDDG